MSQENWCYLFPAFLLLPLVPSLAPERHEEKSLGLSEHRWKTEPNPTVNSLRDWSRWLEIKHFCFDGDPEKLLLVAIRVEQTLAVAILKKQKFVSQKELLKGFVSSVKLCPCVLVTQTRAGTFYLLQKIHKSFQKLCFQVNDSQEQTQLSNFSEAIFIVFYHFLLRNFFCAFLGCLFRSQSSNDAWNPSSFFISYFAK